MKKIALIFSVLFCFYACEKQGTNYGTQGESGIIFDDNNNSSMIDGVWEWQKSSLIEDYGYIDFQNQQIQTYYNYQEAYVSDSFKIFWDFKLDNTMIWYEFDKGTWIADTLNYGLKGDSIYLNIIAFGINTITSQTLDVSIENYSTSYEPEFSDTTFYYSDLFNLNFVSSKLPTMDNVRYSSQKTSKILFFKRKIN